MLKFFDKHPMISGTVRVVCAIYIAALLVSITFGA